MADYPDSILIEPLPGPFDVSIRPPGSKSLTNRALLLAALAEGASTLTGVLFSDDTRVMMRALQELGFDLDIDEANTTVTVEGRGGIIPAKRAELHLGNAGTAMRFLTAACCLGEQGSEYVLDGIPRMRERPIGELVGPLRQLGAEIEYLGEESYPPLKIIAGGLAGGRLHIQRLISSQYLSALLQIAPCADDGIGIEIDSTAFPSAPYVHMTINLMQHPFGVDVNHEIDEMSINGPRHRFHVVPQGYQSSLCRIEPDASNASYFLAAAAICESRCVIEGLGLASFQGDARFADVLKQSGASVEKQLDLVVIAGDKLRSIDIDLNAMPDVAMTLATAAVFADGPTTIRNVGNWRVKETDRMAAMKAELEKVGATVEINGDDITIHPPVDGVIRNPKDGIDTYDDHRMAMAFSILGLRPGGPGITINDPGCVAKTYPSYWEDLDRLRASAVKTAVSTGQTEGGAA